LLFVAHFLPLVDGLAAGMRHGAALRERDIS
jgi:hypothetical protein